MRIEFLRWLEKKEGEIVSQWIERVKEPSQAPVFSQMDERVLRQLGELLLDLWLETNFDPEDYLDCEECQKFISQLKKHEVKFDEIFYSLMSMAKSILSYLFKFPKLNKMQREFLRKAIEDIYDCVSLGFVNICRKVNE